jgi:prepilin-type N-terminal cleavage/methylation domain-containing protein/prepilin-type processing-associated H-X9-DG protein
MISVPVEPHRSRHQVMMHAFTLIELLVVISIISILISILMPALGKARKSARTLTCTNLLRQYGMISEAYSAQNKGYYPPLSQPLPGVSNSSWAINPELKALMSVNELADQWWWGRNKVCPDAKAAMVNQWGQTLDGNIARAFGMSPGKNWSTDKDMLWWNNYRGIRNTDPIQPNRSLWYADAKNAEVTRAGSDYSSYWDLYGDDPSTYYNEMLAFRHDDRANLVFYDGHAKTMNKQDVYPNDALWYIKKNP